MRPKTVMLTGAGGFLGSHLVPMLAEKGLQIVAVTSKSLAQLEERCGIPLHEGVVEVIVPEDTKGLRTNMSKTDVLISCAFPRDADGRELGKGLSFIARLFDLAAACHVGAVINISSQSVYSRKRTEPASEDTPVCLESAYATAKYATELMLNSSCKGIPHTSIRLASLIGPGFDQRVVNKMVKQAVSGHEIEVLSNSYQFSYLDIRDAVRGIASVLDTSPASWQSAYNMGNSSTYNLAEIAEEVVLQLSERGIKASWHFASDCADFRKDYESPGGAFLDSSRIALDCGWCSAVALSESVQAIVAGELVRAEAGCYARDNNRSDRLAGRGTDGSDGS